jgi:hypothetical protein
MNDFVQAHHFKVEVTAHLDAGRQGDELIDQGAQFIHLLPQLLEVLLPAAVARLFLEALQLLADGCERPPQVR